MAGIYVNKVNGEEKLCKYAIKSRDGLAEEPICFSCHFNAMRDKNIYLFVVQLTTNI